MTRTIVITGAAAVLTLAGAAPVFADTSVAASEATAPA
jgi:hypothetical protein